MSQPSDVWSVLASAANQRPHAQAIAGSGTPRVDYRELHTIAARLGGALRDAGVGPGDRVALLEHNTPAFLTWTFACAAAEAILVPLNSHLAAAELRVVLADAEPSLVVAHVSALERIEEACAALDAPPRIVPMGTAPEQSPETPPFGLALGSMLEPSERIDPDAVAQLYYTSGTTGRPKGVPLTHRNIVTHALAATSELDLAEDDTWGHIAPMFHLADAWATVAVTAACGCHAFVPRFEARTTLAAIDELGITVTNLVPTMILRLLRKLDELGTATFRGTSLRLVMSGGAPIAEATVARILDRFGCEYVQTYGLTETSPYLTLAILEPHHREQSSAKQLARRARTGRPFETVELDVVDEHGTSVARDDQAVGEIVARGSSVTPGYWQQPDETARVFRNGWFHTGDLATIDGEGWLNIVDRRKDMIVSGGENVYSIEVENALYAHPAVQECAAFGVPSAEWGEEVRAAVVARAPVEEAALREHCRGVLARFKVPRKVYFLDSLPKTGSGKLRKRTLREQFADAPDSHCDSRAER